MTKEQEATERQPVYRVGFAQPNIKSDWSERTLKAAGGGAEIVVGPSAFAFGAVVAVCPDRTTAALVAYALNVIVAIRNVDNGQWIDY